MRTEVEARFGSEDAVPLDLLARRPTLGRASLGPGVTVAEIDRYLDTEDGRLAAARWACRLRTRGAETRLSLKGPPADSGTPDGGGVPAWRHRRPEVEGPATADIEPEAWPTGPARALLDRLREGADLHEQLRFDQERTERPVRVDGRRLGTLTLDRVAMTSEGRDLGRLHVVELELDDATTDGLAVLDELAAELAAVPGLSPEGRSKLEHALERRAHVR